MQIQTEIYNH